MTHVRDTFLKISFFWRYFLTFFLTSNHPLKTPKSLCEAAAAFLDHTKWWVPFLKSGICLSRAPSVLGAERSRCQSQLQGGMRDQAGPVIALLVTGGMTPPSLLTFQSEPVKCFPFTCKSRLTPWPLAFRGGLPFPGASSTLVWGPGQLWCCWNPESTQAEGLALWAPTHPLIPLSFLSSSRAPSTCQALLQSDTKTDKSLSL